VTWQDLQFGILEEFTEAAYNSAEPGLRFEVRMAEWARHRTDRKEQRRWPTEARKQRAWSRAWKAKNKDRVAAYAAAYRNSEKARARRRERDADPERRAKSVARVKAARAAGRHK